MVDYDTQNCARVSRKGEGFSEYTKHNGDECRLNTQEDLMFEKQMIIIDLNLPNLANASLCSYELMPYPSYLHHPCLGILTHSLLPGLLTEVVILHPLPVWLPFPPSRLLP